MTIAFDPVCWGAEHAPFNAALLATLRAAYPDEAITFFAERDHLASVRALVAKPDTGIEWRDLVIAPRRMKEWRERLPMDWRACANVVRAARTLQAPRLIACGTTATGLAALKGLLFAAPRRLHAAVVHHSGIASLVGSRSTRMLIEFANGNRLRHIVLGTAIRTSVLRSAGALARSLYAMPHPYIFPDGPAPCWPAAGPVRFGFAGVASRGKGFAHFCRLAQDAGRDAAFELIGPVSKEYQDQPPSGFHRVHRMGSTAFIPRDCYEQRLAAVTYAVYPYDPGAYAMVSSGAILDAFLTVKPSIVLRNPLFEEYFAAMGDIGYLCDDYEHLRETVQAVLRERPEGRYLAQCENIRRGRAIFEPAAVAGALGAILN